MGLVSPRLIAELERFGEDELEKTERAFAGDSESALMRDRRLRVGVANGESGVCALLAPTLEMDFGEDGGEVSVRVVIVAVADMTRRILLLSPQKKEMKESGRRRQRGGLGEGS